MEKSNPVISAVVVGVLFMIAGCAGTGGSTSEAGRPRDANMARITDLSNDLTDYLTRFSGVIVRGSGPYAVIRVRGINSVNSGIPPLFILDGMRLGRDYAEVYSMVNIREVRSVRVLKGSAANIYGVAGGHGVIIIDTVAPPDNIGL